MGRSKHNYLFPLIMVSNFTRAEITFKNEIETSTHKKNCSAKREYVVLDTSKTSQYYSSLVRINQKVKKRMTVGRKLNHQDCPENSSDERFEYINLATISGQNNTAIGISFTFLFPGGSGRYIKNCFTYKLNDGSEIDLKKCLKKNAIPQIQKRLCQKATNDHIDYNQDQQERLKKYHCNDSFNDAELCLHNKGVNVLVPWLGNWRTVSESFLLSSDEINEYFTKKCTNFIKGSN